MPAKNLDGKSQRLLADAVVEFWTHAYQAINAQPVAGIKGVFQKICKFVARNVRRFHPDPIVKVRIGERALLMPWSHQLPNIRRAYPLYESEIGRVAEYLLRTDGYLRMIDVGANVGDTVATLPSGGQATYLCIEASTRYFDLLRRNYHDVPGVTPALALLGDSNRSGGGGRVVELDGTAHIEGTDGSDATTPWVTLDELVAQHPAFMRVNFIKVDTDGFDLRVLRGGSRTIETAKPCLHIEVSPIHWRDFGGCAISDGLSFLAEHGYGNILVYDNIGHIFGRDKTTAPAFLPMLENYALRNPHFYLNIVAFNAARSDVDAFYFGELSAMDPALK